MAGETEFMSLHHKLSYGAFSLYASHPVLITYDAYVQKFSLADAILSPHDPPLHPAYREAAKSYNDLVLEMRRDALAWSVFGYRGPSRVSDA